MSLVMISLEVRVEDLGIDDFFEELSKQKENSGIGWGNFVVREL